MKKIATILVIIIMSFLLFYMFMTYDRNYTWAKEYPNEIKQIAELSNLKIERTEKINVDKVQLPTERKIKIKIQKFLNNLGLMSYGTEVGEKIILKSEDENSNIICKSWCLSDHLIGLEVQYKNIGEQELGELKKQFENQFSKYKLIWTKLK